MIFPAYAPIQVLRWPFRTEGSVTPPKEMLQKFLFKALAIDLAKEVFPIPGPPIRHKILPLSPFFNLPIAISYSILSLTVFMPQCSQSMTRWAYYISNFSWDSLLQGMEAIVLRQVSCIEDYTELRQVCLYFIISMLNIFLIYSGGFMDWKIALHFYIFTIQLSIVTLDLFFACSLHFQQFQILHICLLQCALKSVLIYLFYQRIHQLALVYCLNQILIDDLYFFKLARRLQVILNSLFIIDRIANNPQNIITSKVNIFLAVYLQLPQVKGYKIKKILNHNSVCYLCFCSQLLFWLFDFGNSQLVLPIFKVYLFYLLSLFEDGLNFYSIFFFNLKLIQFYILNSNFMQTRQFYVAMVNKLDFAVDRHIIEFLCNWNLILRFGLMEHFLNQCHYIICMLIFEVFDHGLCYLTDLIESRQYMLIQYQTFCLYQRLAALLFFGKCLILHFLITKSVSKWVDIILKEPNYP